MTEAQELNSATPPQMDDLESILSKLDEPQSTSIVQEIVVQEQVPTAQGIVEPAPQPENPVRIKEFVERYEVGFSEILSSVRSDRTEAQKVIDFCTSELDKMSQAGRVSASMVESLVQAVKTKSDITTNYIKCLDAGAKLISATKSAININNNNTVSNDSMELTALLQTPVVEDDI